MPEFVRVDSTRPVCKHLRTKALSAYGADTHDAYHTSRSSSYQCLKTCFVTGPDKALCAPEECQPSRRCFEQR